MSSIVDIFPRKARGSSELFDYEDGKALILHDEADDRQIVWSLEDYLASGETVTSAAYEDSGATTSGRSVVSPLVTFTITGYGSTRVTATLSSGRQVTRSYYALAPEGGERRSDYR